MTRKLKRSLRKRQKPTRYCAILKSDNATTNLVKQLSKVVQELEDLVADLPTSTTSSHTSATSLAVAASEGLAGASAGPQQYRGGDLRLKTKLTLEEIATGVTKKFKVKKQVECNECHGSGSEPGHNAETCSTCHGSGYVIRNARTIFGTMQQQSPCPTCHGEGKVVTHKCKKCHGDGVVAGEEVIEVRIPAGVAEGMVVTVPGKGHAGKHNGVPGDIQVLIEELPHEHFIRDDNDLIYNLLLTVSQATLGDQVEVPTLEGKARVTIKPGTQPGTRMRLRSKGLPAVQGYGYGRGDIVINISVYIPETLSKEEKEAFEAMKESDNLKPSPSILNKIFNSFRAYFS